jgi:hypothetical protein
MTAAGVSHAVRMQTDRMNDWISDCARAKAGFGTRRGEE